METLLTLGGAQLPPFSARGCTQTLIPILTGELRRTVNGDLLHIGAEKHFKYKSTITCEDKASPCLEGLWRGQEVRVGCLVRLHQGLKQSPHGAGTTLMRLAVEGSVVGYDQEGKACHVVVNGQEVHLWQNDMAHKHFFVSYAPQLHMRVISFQIKTDEWGAKVGWSLELEEI